MDGIESSDNYIGDTLTNMSTLSDTFQKTDHADQKDPLEQQVGTVTINVIPQFQYTISAAGAFTQRVNQVNNNDDSVSNILRNQDAVAASETGDIGVEDNTLQFLKDGVNKYIKIEFLHAALAAENTQTGTPESLQVVDSDNTAMEISPAVTAQSLSSTTEFYANVSSASTYKVQVTQNSTPTVSNTTTMELGNVVIKSLEDPLTSAAADDAVFASVTYEELEVTTQVNDVNVDLYSPDQGTAFGKTYFSVTDTWTVSDQTLEFDQVHVDVWNNIIANETYVRDNNGNGGLVIGKNESNTLTLEAGHTLVSVTGNSILYLGTMTLVVDALYFDGTNEISQAFATTGYPDALSNHDSITNTVSSTNPFTHFKTLDENNENSDATVTANGKSGIQCSLKRAVINTADLTSWEASELVTMERTLTFHGYYDIHGDAQASSRTIRWHLQATALDARSQLGAVTRVYDVTTGHPNDGSDTDLKNEDYPLKSTMRAIAGVTSTATDIPTAMSTGDAANATNASYNLTFAQANLASTPANSLGVATDEETCSIQKYAAGTTNNKACIGAFNLSATYTDETSTQDGLYLPIKNLLETQDNEKLSILVRLQNKHVSNSRDANAPKPTMVDSNTMLVLLNHDGSQYMTFNNTTDNVSTPSQTDMSLIQLSYAYSPGVDFANKKITFATADGLNAGTQDLAGAADVDFGAYTISYVKYSGTTIGTVSTTIAALSTNLEGEGTQGTNITSTDGGYALSDTQESTYWDISALAATTTVGGNTVLDFGNTIDGDANSASFTAISKYTIKSGLTPSTVTNDSNTVLLATFSNADKSFGKYIGHYNANTGDAVNGLGGATIAESGKVRIYLGFATSVAFTKLDTTSIEVQLRTGGQQAMLKKEVIEISRNVKAASSEATTLELYAANASLVAGLSVTGQGNAAGSIADGTTIASIDGTTITLSQALSGDISNLSSILFEGEGPSTLKVGPGVALASADSGNGNFSNQWLTDGETLAANKGGYVMQTSLDNSTLVTYEAASNGGSAGATDTIDLTLNFAYGDTNDFIDTNGAVKTITLDVYGAYALTNKDDGTTVVKQRSQAFDSSGILVVSVDDIEEHLNYPHYAVLGANVERAETINTLLDDLQLVKSPEQPTTSSNFGANADDSDPTLPVYGDSYEVNTTTIKGPLIPIESTTGGVFVLGNGMKRSPLFKDPTDSTKDQVDVMEDALQAVPEAKFHLVEWSSEDRTENTCTGIVSDKTDSSVTVTMTVGSNLDTSDDSRFIVVASSNLIGRNSQSKLNGVYKQISATTLVREMANSDNYNWNSGHPSQTADTFSAEDIVLFKLSSNTKGAFSESLTTKAQFPMNVLDNVTTILGLDSITQGKEYALVLDVLDTPVIGFTAYLGSSNYKFTSEEDDINVGAPVHLTYHSDYKSDHEDTWEAFGISMPNPLFATSNLLGQLLHDFKNNEVLQRKALTSTAYGGIVKHGRYCA